MIDFTMPALGSDMDEGTLVEWLVKPGDAVGRGQVLAVVETPKSAIEVECWHDGTVRELLVPAGETVRVGTALASLLEPGEPAPSVPAGGGATLAGPESHRRRWVSPAARRLAATVGVDTDTVTGTGPQGVVTIEDVERVATAAQAPSAVIAADRGSAMRKSIAAAMSRSNREIPHYYLEHRILLDKALSWLTDRNARRPVTERLLPAVLQVKAVAVAARRFGEFSGFWRGDEFRPAPDVHVGVAISLRGGGLVAPALRGAADQDLDELMGNMIDLVSRARAGRLRSSEISDPTITVTNLGDNGVDSVFGVIYPPQVALVGFGKPSPQACAIDGDVRISTAVQATLAADHRASDGHRGALFLAAVNDLLQQPDALEK